MSFINDLHKFIQFLANQGQTQYQTPTDIDDAVHRATYDIFYDSLKKYKETGEMDDMLQVFKTTSTIALTAGVGTLPSNFIEDFGAANIISSKEYEAEYRGDDKWNSRDMSDLIPDPDKPDNPLHWYLQQDPITLTTGEGDLPEDFVKEVAFGSAISGAGHFGHLIKPKAIAKERKKQQ